jgi:hypothetical protein
LFTCLALADAQRTKKAQLLAADVLAEHRL